MAATGMLAVGGSVLVCGLGWMLVTYGEYLATTDMTRPVRVTPKTFHFSAFMGVSWVHAFQARS